MALRTAVASGNFSDPGTWDTGVPGTGDTAECAGFTVVIDTDVTCDQLQSSGAGYFSVTSAPRSITANIRSNTGHTGGGVVRCSHTTGTVTINGNVQAGSNKGVDNSNAGALTINGTVTGGSAIYAYGMRNTSTGTVTITACQGGSYGECHGVYNTGTGTVTIGTCTGGTGYNNVYGAYNGSTGAIIITTCNGGSASYCHGVRNAGNGTVTITTCTGGSNYYSYGAQNSGAGTITIGTATGGSGNGAHGAHNDGAGKMTVTKAVGNDYGPGGTHSNSNVGVYGTKTSGQITEVYQIEYGAHGQSPTGGSVTLVDSEDNQAQFQVVLGGTTKTLSAAGTPDFPATRDVRLGTTYNDGALTGTLAVPAANQVAVGIAVDDGVGTAVLTAESAAAAIWDALRADHNTADTFGAVSEWTRLVSDQDIRDAMRLAPSAGTPAGGSIDAELADLADTLATIQGTGWTTETLKEIYDLIKTRAAPGDAMSFTMNAASVAIALSEQVIQVYRGDVISMTITPSVSRNISNRTKAWFVIKDDKNDPDSASWIFIEETAGLTVAFGESYSTPTDGSIEITDESSGAFKLTLKAPVTSQMTKGTRYWDFQVLESDGPHTVATGTCTVTLDVARVIT